MELEKKELRTFRIDGDTLTIEFRYDTTWNVWLGDYPYFKEEPRLTPGGRSWRNVTHDECPYAAGKYADCGSCPYLRKQDEDDLIGVCFHNALCVTI